MTDAEKISSLEAEVKRMKEAINTVLREGPVPTFLPFAPYAKTQSNRHHALLTRAVGGTYHAHAGPELLDD